VIEFALILPMLMILVFGIIDFSIELYDKAVITNASREGARTGIVYRFPALSGAALSSTVNTAVQDYCSSYLVTFGGPSSPAVNATVGVDAEGHSQLTVTVTYQYVFSVIPNFIPSITNPTLTATTVMRME
jgi:Flp pilus assembly protein TadG